MIGGVLGHVEVRWSLGVGLMAEITANGALVVWVLHFYFFWVHFLSIVFIFGYLFEVSICIECNTCIFCVGLVDYNAWDNFKKCESELMFVLMWKLVHKWSFVSSIFCLFIIYFLSKNLILARLITMLIDLCCCLCYIYIYIYIRLDWTGPWIRPRSGWTWPKGPAETQRAGFGAKKMTSLLNMPSLGNRRGPAGRVRVSKNPPRTQSVAIPSW